LNELIEDFISHVFTPGYIENIRKAISLFEAFEHQNAYGGITDVITNESVSDIQSRANHFVIELNNQLDYIVKQHLIELTDNATTHDRIIILDALFRIQHLENYITIISILTSEEDSVDKLSRILEELTEYDQAHFLHLLKEVNVRTLELLELYIENQLQFEEEEPVDYSIIERVKLFNDVLGKSHIGFVLLDAGMKVGYPLRLYLPFVEEHLVVENNNEQSALNILSIIYMSDTPEQAILTTYRDVGETAFKSIDLVGRAENFVLKMISKIQDTRKINNEKTRLS